MSKLRLTKTPIIVGIFLFTLAAVFVSPFRPTGWWTGAGVGHSNSAPHRPDAASDDAAVGDLCKTLLTIAESPTLIRDRQMRHGQWIVLLYSVNSVQDVAAANGACDIAKAVAGKCKVLLVPTAAYETLSAFEPRSKSNAPTGPGPIWLHYRDGRFIDEFAGAMTVDEAIAFTERTSE